MLETKITEILEKQKLIKKKLDNHEISFLEGEEELSGISHEIEKELKKDTFKSLKEPTTENHIECSCVHKAKSVIHSKNELLILLSRSYIPCDFATNNESEVRCYLLLFFCNFFSKKKLILFPNSYALNYNWCKRIFTIDDLYYILLIF